VLFQQMYSYAQYDERCWILNHYVMTRGPNTTKSGRALWDFPAKNNLALLATMLGIYMRWHDGQTYNSVLYYSTRNSKDSHRHNSWIGGPVIGAAIGLRNRRNALFTRRR
jgi:hypothetical protein